MKHITEFEMLFLYYLKSEFYKQSDDISLFQKAVFFLFFLCNYCGGNKIQLTFFFPEQKFKIKLFFQK